MVSQITDILASCNTLPLIRSAAWLLRTFCCPERSTEDSLMLPPRKGKGKLQETALQWEYLCLHKKRNCSGCRKGETCHYCMQEGNKVGSKLPVSHSARRSCRIIQVLRGRSKKPPALTNQAEGSLSCGGQDCGQSVVEETPADEFVCPVSKARPASTTSRGPFQTQPAHIRACGSRKPGGARWQAKEP